DHGLRILREDEGAGFSPKAAYIFRKQLEEADAILINRIDELAEGQLRELSGLIARHFPGTPLLPVSARTGQGFDGLIELLDQEGDFGRKILEIDYDTYAEGEAEMGWLNTSVHIAAPRPFALDQLLAEVVARLRDRLVQEQKETAHLKAIGLSEGTFAVANLVSNLAAPELSLPSRATVGEAEVIVNARVAMDPDELQVLVRQTIQAACQGLQATFDFRT